MAHMMGLGFRVGSLGFRVRGTWQVAEDWE